MSPYNWNSTISHVFGVNGSNNSGRMAYDVVHVSTGGVRPVISLEKDKFILML